MRLVQNNWQLGIYGYPEGYDNKGASITGAMLTGAMLTGAMLTGRLR